MTPSTATFVKLLQLLISPSQDLCKLTLLALAKDDKDLASFIVSNLTVAYHMLGCGYLATGVDLVAASVYYQLGLTGLTLAGALNEADSGELYLQAKSWLSITEKDSIDIIKSYEELVS